MRPLPCIVQRAAAATFGSLDEAHRWATAALARAREMGYQFSEAVALDALATASRRLGHADARTCRSRAIRRAQEASDLVTEAEILVGAARDGYQDAVESSSPENHPFRAARAAARRALDAGLASESPHV
jgi:hypothetical protein